MGYAEEYVECWEPDGLKERNDGVDTFQRETA